MSLFYINEPLKPYKYQSIAKEMDTYGYKCTNGYIYIYISLNNIAPSGSTNLFEQKSINK